MEKIALITDSTSDMTKETVGRYDVKILHYRIIYKDREFTDRINITPKYVYDNMDREIPTSSLPSIDEMESLFNSLQHQGYTHAIVITLSGGLTGILNGVKLVSENYPQIKTYIYDSKSISMGEGIIVEECAKLIKKGMNFDEIVSRLPALRKRLHLYFVVGTLEYLKKGGRIGKVAGTIAELLNIKPIVAIDTNDGKYFTYDKVRGRKKSLNRIVEIADSILKNKKCRMCVLHGCALEDSQKVYNQIKKHPNVVSASFGGDISPVAGVHSGPGLVGLVLFEEE
ncbi:DegV family protein [Clostridium luticellarii]|uniref:DegV domain-containing protein n=1 Tax=Clostridium luticellarii TaxID=1691940 RepID=A0A2T0BNK5_9CLOT|nr:DegV family protein [Clostridium luticellarii]PRR85450.1 DegV domain-containing protein [Clostridium luticellarii]